MWKKKFNDDLQIYNTYIFKSYKNGILQKPKASSNLWRNISKLFIYKEKITVTFNSVTCLYISTSQLKNILQLTQRQFLQSELYTHPSDQKFYQPLLSWHDIAFLYFNSL